jgi:putative ABC transport system substrate-binding protein
MRRREFITLLGGAAAASSSLWPRTARAQQTRLVGVLMNGSVKEAQLQANVTAFMNGLRDLGWVEGRNLRLNVRYNEGNAASARMQAAELVALAPEVILSASTTNLRALQGATRVIPIVFLQVSDPVMQGFVATITKPGGNITGFSAYEFSIGGKWLELLKQMSPGLARVGVMSNPDTSPQSELFIRAIEAAAPSFGLQVAAAPVRTIEDIEAVTKSYGSQGSGGLILPTDSFTRLHLKTIAERAIQFRMPVIAAFPEFVDDGGLMFYGTTTREQLAIQFRAAASYVDRILKGAKPGDLPVQGATTYGLFINRKTATALGLEIPARLLFTAERVIE